ncbi:MAG: hypothetical protein HQ526_04930 [Actinobacteria bacterium]|nr:hypothetical protein [Actinomycetota bacterium]
MLRTLFVIITIAIIFLIFRSMWRSWQRRIVKGEVIPALPDAPTERGQAMLAIDHATYLGTVTDEHWLDRVAAQGLGGRGPSELVVLSAGLVIERAGAATHFIPKSAINEVALAKGIAGRVYGEDSVVVVSWTWGSTLMHTGLRVVDKDSRLGLVHALTQWGPGGSQTDRQPAKSKPAERSGDIPPTPGGEK